MDLVNKSVLDIRLLSIKCDANERTQIRSRYTQKQLNSYDRQLSRRKNSDLRSTTSI